MHRIKCTICESEKVNLYQRPDAPELFNLYCLDCRAHATIEPFEIEAAELARYKQLEDEGRLLILPSPQEMQELNDNLCEFCRAKGYNRMFHTPRGIDLGCEGAHCSEAYEKYLDNVYDAAGVELPTHEAALEGAGG